MLCYGYYAIMDIMDIISVLQSQLDTSIYIYTHANP
jgi:hypothetical protein